MTALTVRPSLCLERDPPRKKYIWIAAACLVLGCCLVLALSPECGRSTSKEFHAAVVMPIVSIVVMAFFLDDRRRYDPDSLLWLWAWRFAAFNMAASTFIMAWYVAWNNSCSGNEPVWANGVLIGLYQAVLTIGSVMLAHVTLLKLHMLHGFSERFALWSFRGCALFGISAALSENILNLFDMDIVTYCIGGLAMLCMCLFFGKAISDLCWAAAEARREVHESDLANRSINIQVARYAILTSASTCLAFLTVMLQVTLGILRSCRVCWAAASSLDFTCNAFSAVVLSGLLGPRVQVEQQAVALASVLAERRERFMLQKMLEAEQAGTGKAAVLAAVLNSRSSSPSEVISKGRQRFRCISWDVLRNRPEIICQGPCQQDTYQKAAADLYALSEACEFGECDVFLSHSWHDNAELKWKTLEGWCEAFRCRCGRTPRLWLDKVCIDQTDIEGDLQCLPIFLAACPGLLVISGPTYTSRLWCILELFVYLSIMEGDEEVGFGTMILPLSQNAEETRILQQSWENVSSLDCQCSNMQDKERIMKLISNYPGGIASFDHRLGELAGRMLPTAEPVDLPDPSMRRSGKESMVVVGQVSNSLPESARAVPATNAGSVDFKPMLPGMLGDLE